MKKITLTILIVSFALRVIALNKLPPAMYWEEVALGYDAYSILKTGSDHHGNFLPIVSFESFGDYKPALYFYSIIPFIFILGLSVWAVRLPSAIAGVMIVYFTGKITERITSSELKSPIQPKTFAMLFTAISPWALQFSRSGWEVNLATAFITSGVYFGLVGVQSLAKYNAKKILKAYLPAVLCFVLAAYTYHATRIIGPLLGIFLALPLFFKFHSAKKEIFILGVLGFTLMIPLLISFKDPTLNHRLQETSAFTSMKEITDSNMFIKQFGNNVFSRLVFHRYWFFLRTILENFFAHLRFDYLFISGDENPRHSIQYFGLLYPLDVFLLFLGILFAYLKKKKAYLFLLIWWVIGVFPASLTKATPHALRTLPTLPVFMILLSFGASYGIELVKGIPFKKFVLSTIIGMFVIQFVVFVHFYLLVYPKQYSDHWQYGYKDMVQSIQDEKKEGETIFISREQGRPAMYYWFFTKTDPKLVQADEAVAQKDQGEFLSFQNVKFVSAFTGSERGILATSPKIKELFPNAQVLSTVNDLKGKTVWIVYRN